MIILAFLFGSPISAQVDAPLVGPVVGTTSAQDDRILLYDMGTHESDGQPTVRELSFGVGEHHLWGFSPNGCRMMFTRDADVLGLPRLYTANLDGSDVQDMVLFDDLAPDAWGVWEPNWSSRNRIAFTMIRFQPLRNGSLERQTHMAWIDGSAPGAPEFYSVTGREFSPTWSDDGEWLAYMSYDERVPGADIQSTAVPTVEPPPGVVPEQLPTILESDLWVVRADGETKYRLTNFSTGSARHPRWSPDGDLIGFVYAPSASNDTLWMIGAQEGANPTQLSYFWNLTLDHTWLPDSTAMLASVRDFRGIDQNRLWRIPLVGNADNDATLYLADDAFQYTDYPRFSPDGRYLAFRSEYVLVVVDLNSNTWQKINPDVPGNMPPVWSPGGFAGEGSCG